MAEEKYVVGVDLGGTKIYAAVVDKDGKIIATARKKTKSELGFEQVTKRITSCIEEAISNAKVDKNDILSIGMGSPGPLDLKEGKIIETPNLGWKDAPLQDRIKKAFKLPVKIDNDCNVGILGEYAYGCGHGSKYMVGLFIGTGVGGGVIINGKLLHGFNENAGELGHMIIDPTGPQCGCGNHGCLEAFASRLSIEREIRKAIKNGISSKILEKLEDPNDKFRSGVLAELFKKKDPAVTQAIIKSAEYVGFATASLLNIFNPETVVIGGGVIEALGEAYVKIVRNVAFSNVFPIATRNVRIVCAELGDDSAILGAANLAWDIV